MVEVESTLFVAKKEKAKPKTSTRKASPEEHHELTGLADKIKAALTRLTQLPAGAERDTLNRQISELFSAINTSLVNHLAIEEAILFPSIEANMPVEEQIAIDKAYVKGKPFKQMALFVPWYMTNLTQEQQDAVKAKSPLILKFLYYAFWLKKYNRMAASFQV